jgi:quinol monooxygenase YgiN
MPALPWRSFATPDNGTEYTALLSYLPLNNWGAMPKFIRYTPQIRRRLAASEGCVGYALDAHVPQKEFWTLSVWEDDESLREFVRHTPHSKAMMDLLPHMGQTDFLTFKIEGSSVPPDWKDARHRMSRNTETPQASENRPRKGRVEPACGVGYHRRHDRGSPDRTGRQVMGGRQVERSVRGRNRDPQGHPRRRLGPPRLRRHRRRPVGLLIHDAADGEREVVAIVSAEGGSAARS